MLIYLVIVNKNRRLRWFSLSTVYFIIRIKIQCNSLEFVRRRLIIDHAVIMSKIGLLLIVLPLLFTLFLSFFDFTSSYRSMKKNAVSLHKKTNNYVKSSFKIVEIIRTITGLNCKYRKSYINLKLAIESYQSI